MSKPRIDSFGNFQIGPGPASRGRLIQMGGTDFALFPEKNGMPVILTFEDAPTIKGRTLRGTLTGAETPDPTFVFQRASCGCQTPKELKGPARNFLKLLEPADV